MLNDPNSVGLIELRLEARRLPGEPGYEVALYRKEWVSIASFGVATEKSGHPPKGAWTWVVYDLIRSDLPTPEQALEQVLGYLEMRCQ